MSNKPKVVFSLQNSDGVDIVWATDDGKWHAPYGIDGPGHGIELPPDVMSTNVYDVDMNGIVDLAENLVPEAKIDWSQLINVPDLTLSWSNIIDIPDSLVHQPDLDLVIQEVNSQFQIRDNEIASKVSTTDFQIKISNINSEINSVRESKRNYFNSVDYYTQDKVKSKLVSWFYQGEPSNSTEPTNKWTTTQLKDQHVGDFYYDVLQERLYTYSKSGSNYSWTEYSTQTVEGIVDALVVHKIASETIDTIEDNYRASFRQEPTTPYFTGDLWMDGDTLMIAAYTREEGAFNPNDWSVATDTYDPSELEALVDELYSQVSTMYDKSNKLDTSWIWSSKPGALLSKDLTSLYKHNPEVRSSNTKSSTVLDGATPFKGTDDRILRLTSSNEVVDGFNFGIRFGDYEVPSTLVQVDNNYNYRLSFWMKASSVEDLRIVVDDYNEHGVEDTTNNAHKSRPLSYVNAGTHQWVLGVMHLVTKDDDLNDAKFKTQVYNLDGVNIANLSSDLNPIKYSQNNLRIAIRSNVSESTEMEIYSIRLDELNPSVPYPSVQELITNRVKRSGVVEELRGYIANVEHRVADDRIINLVTRSDVFASRFPTVVSTDKPSISWSAPEVREYDLSAGHDYLTSISHDFKSDVGVDSVGLTLSEVSYKHFEIGTSDGLDIRTSRSDMEVLSTLTYEVVTEVEIISDSPNFASRVITLGSRSYFNPSGVVTNPSFSSGSVYTPGSVVLTMSPGSTILDTVYYVDSSGYSVALRYTYYIKITAASEGIPYSHQLPVNLSILGDSSSPRIQLVTTNGTSMHIEEDDEGNEVGVYPSMLSVEAHLYNTGIKRWEIRFQDSNEWITIDPNKFTTSDYGILPLPTTTQVPEPKYIGMRTLMIDGDIRYLLPLHMKNPSWSSTTPRDDMTNYTKWYIRVVDDFDQTSAVVLDITPNIGEVIKSLRTTTAQLVISTEGIQQSVETLNIFKNTASQTLVDISALVDQINLRVNTLTITTPYYAYSKHPDGTNFSFDPNDGGEYYYVGIAVVAQTEAPTDKSDYVWSRYVGPKGDQGIQGKDGTDGIQGPKGTDGTSQYVFYRYSSNSSGDPMTEDVKSDTKYIGISVVTTNSAPTSPSSYDWAKFVGDDGSDGQQGIPGTPGSDGVTYYTWVRYADSPTTGMSNNPSGKDYIGLAYNKVTSEESSIYSDYQWSLIKGAQGPQGIQGEPGLDGEPTYTWIRYADTASGVGISNDPTGKLYIGFSYNKDTPNESNTPGDYAWSLIKGDKGDTGVKGDPGVDGKTTYTWIKYSDNADGTNPYDVPTNSTKYIGIAINKLTSTESNNKSDYTWSLFKGSDGVSITGVDEYYALSSTNTKPTNWDKNPSPVPTTTTTNKYLWNYEVINRSNGDHITTEARIISTHGSTGATGRGIQKVEDYYATNNSGTTPPATNQFETTLKVPSASERYLWNFERITYTTGLPATEDTIKRVIGVHGTKGEKGDRGIQGVPGLEGEKGDQGVPGPAGSSSYTHLAYATSSSGANFSTSHFPNATYIGMYVDNIAQDSTTPGKYKWSLIKGADGAQGIPGPKGEDGEDGSPGLTPYFHTAWANNSTGTSGFSTTVSANKSHIGTYTDYTQSSSTDPSKYNWVKIKGDTGPQGPPGVKGDPGVDGQSQWVHIRYSHKVPTSNNDMTSQPQSNTKYIGLANTNSATAPSYSGFTWNKYVGDKGDTGDTGPQGIPGTPGVDGTTTYTWVMYADTPTSGISEYPDGKMFIGMAFNKESPDMTNNYSDYKWSLMPQNLEFGGVNYVIDSEEYDFSNPDNELSGADWESGSVNSSGEESESSRRLRSSIVELLPNSTYEFGLDSYLSYTIIYLAWYSGEDFVRRTSYSSTVVTESDIDGVRVILDNNPADVEDLEYLNPALQLLDIDVSDNYDTVSGRNYLLNSDEMVDFEEQDVISTTVGEYLPTDGGRNLFIPSTTTYFRSNNNLVYNIIGEVDEKGNGRIKSVDPTNGQLNTYTTFFYDTIIGETYTQQMMVKSPVDVELRLRGGSYTMCKANKWTKLTAIIVVSGTSTRWWGFHNLLGKPVPKEVWIEYKDIKITRGNNPDEPYSPAPEDFNNLKGKSYDLLQPLRKENILSLNGSFEEDDFIGLWLGNDKFVGFLDNQELTFDLTENYDDEFVVVKTLSEKGIIDNAKLEKGNTPTDWTPAPEDLTHAKQYRLSQSLHPHKEYTLSLDSTNEGVGVWLGRDYFVGYIEDGELRVVDSRNDNLNTDPREIELLPLNNGNVFDNYNYFMATGKMVAGETYTLSFEVEFTQGTSDAISVFTQYGHTSAIALPIKDNKVLYTFEAVATTNENITYLYAGRARSTRDIGVIFRNLKIEKGSVATPYISHDDTRDVLILKALNSDTTIFRTQLERGAIRTDWKPATGDLSAELIRVESEVIGRIDILDDSIAIEKSTRESVVTDLGDLVTVNSGRIDVLDDRVTTTISSRLDNLDSQYEAVNTKVDTATSSIQTFTKRVGDLETGFSEHQTTFQRDATGAYIRGSQWRTYLHADGEKVNFISGDGTGRVRAYFGADGMFTNQWMTQHHIIKSFVSSSGGVTGTIWLDRNDDDEEGNY